MPWLTVARYQASSLESRSALSARLKSFLSNPRRFSSAWSGRSAYPAPADIESLSFWSRYSPAQRGQHQCSGCRHEQAAKRVTFVPMPVDAAKPSLRVIDLGPPSSGLSFAPSIGWGHSPVELPASPVKASVWRHQPDPWRTSIQPFFV